MSTECKESDTAIKAAVNQLTETTAIKSEQLCTKGIKNRMKKCHGSSPCGFNLSVVSLVLEEMNWEVSVLIVSATS